MLEDDGLVVMYDDVVLVVLEYGVGKYCVFDVGVDMY